MFSTAPDGFADFSFGVWSDSQGYNHGDFDPDPTEPTKAIFDHMVGEGVDFAVTERIDLGSHMTLNTLPVNVFGDGFYFSWQVLTATYRF
jgi:hypothetical protein